MGAQAAAVSGGAQVASGIISGMQSRYDAEAQQEIQKNNNKEIDRAAVANYSDLSRAESSIQEGAALASLEQQKAYFKARGKATILAGASGTAGGSVDSILRDLNQTRGQNIATITKNRRTQLDEVALQAEQIRQSAKASKSNRIFSKPSGGLIALNAVAQTADATSKYLGAGG